MPKEAVSSGQSGRLETKPACQMIWQAGGDVYSIYALFTSAGNDQ
jgi:hypothetical protein